MSRHDHYLDDLGQRRLLAAVFPTRIERVMSRLSMWLDARVLASQLRRAESGRTLWKKGK